jgi:hypothetical protein
MDHAQLLALSTDLLGLIAPLIGGGALARGGSGADRATSLALQAWSLLQRHLAGDAEASSAMTLFQARPDKPSRRDDLAELIAERLVNNTAATAELQDLVSQLRALGGSPAPGRAHNQTIGGNAQVGVAVAGDVHGGITHTSTTDNPPHNAPVVRPRAINTWLGDSLDNPDYLEPQRTSRFNCQVGDPLRASPMLGSSAAVPRDDIPVGGLLTSWTVLVRGVRLEAPPGATVEISALPDGWMARFDLHIPEHGDSDIRTLLVTPLSAAVFGLDILITARGQIYRQFQVQLDASPMQVLSFDEPAPLVTHDVVLTRADQLGLRSPHEWQREPGVLRLLVLGNQTFVSGDLAQVDPAGSLTFSSVNRPVEWSVVVQNVQGLIQSVRDAADTFRAVKAHTNYMDDIEAADLAAKLAAFQPTGDWQALPNLADPAHDAAWQQVSQSSELRALARLGYQLYNRVFPNSNPLRAWIDALMPGHRLSITWMPTDAGWTPAVPWGLMYRSDPGSTKPIDPLEFLGLRFRIDYTGYAAQGDPIPKHLGRPDQAHSGHLLYWGGQANDTTASEAGWQRAWLAGMPQQVFAPAEPPGADRKQELLALLEQPGPRPMPLLYLFCQCDLNDGANQPLLRFGSTRDQANTLTIAELPAGPLLDRSLIFANACTTVAGATTLANDLPQHFFDRGCSAFLGTEVRVPITLASRFAAIFFHFFYRQSDREHQPMAAGEAVAQTRLFLWTRYRNIGGLLYTYINQYELFLADEQEVQALRS